MAEEENRDNIDPLNGENQLRQRQRGSPRADQLQQPILQPDNNEALKVYKRCAYGSLALVCLCFLVIAGLVYLLYNRSFELELCKKGHVSTVSCPDSTKDSFCEKELDKWQRLFLSERNVSKEVVNKVITDADSYTFIKSDLDVCRERLWYIWMALAVTWGSILCLILLFCYCCRRQQRYTGQRFAVAYNRDY